MTTALSGSSHLASQLMERIYRGELTPGTQLSEIPLADELGCSRNTLREAFRVLARDGLVDHIPNRGVFVHTFTREDVNGLYDYRIFVEAAVIREAANRPVNLEECLTRMEYAYLTAVEEAAAGNWRKVGTANSAFHQALVDIVGIKRLSNDIRKILALARIGFLSTGGEETTHGPYVEKNRQLLVLMKAGKYREAEEFIREYLEHSRNNLLSLLPDS